MDSLKKRLTEWQDPDSAVFELMIVLGLAPDDPDMFRAYSHIHSWSGPLSDALHYFLLRDLVLLGVITEEDQESRFCWNQDFKAAGLVGDETLKNGSFKARTENFRNNPQAMAYELGRVLGMFPDAESLPKSFFQDLWADTRVGKLLCELLRTMMGIGILRESAGDLGSCLTWNRDYKILPAKI